jgi:hypothetical protein
MFCSNESIRKTEKVLKWEKTKSRAVEPGVKLKRMVSGRETWEQI